MTSDEQLIALKKTLEEFRATSAEREKAYLEARREAEEAHASAERELDRIAWEFRAIIAAGEQEDARRAATSSDEVR